MTIKININVIVRVRLTEYGKNILDHYKCDHCGYFGELEGDWYISSLWEVMKIFGPHYHMGNITQPLKDNEIVADSFDGEIIPEQCQLPDSDTLPEWVNAAIKDRIALFESDKHTWTIEMRDGALNSLYWILHLRKPEDEPQ